MSAISHALQADLVRSLQATVKQLQQTLEVVSTQRDILFKAAEENEYTQRILKESLQREMDTNVIITAEKANWQSMRDGNLQRLKETMHFIACWRGMLETDRKKMCADFTPHPVEIQMSEYLTEWSKIYGPAKSISPQNSKQSSEY